ncbi:class I SAM-dependent methyltransferase [Rhizobium sp. NRK18]|uniref:class I SAM-dependent methyltransferase n=1 Tax=Rhizobium sp. NRK18 TaxID=2964667 RepID=UPI0021C4BCB2|nr:class I SAM-dependent methyltransferase [Rhizobium sp. NRK18]MCQ2003111.1 class I SAM-dependent methyltransferase [Rhizobium sp. NRK18]
MDPIFDHELIAKNRERAKNLPEGPATFLLDIAAEELAGRLGAVEREFEEAAELHGGSGVTARMLVETGKVGRMRRIETSTAFAADDEDILIAPLDAVPLEPQSVNLIVSPLSLHVTNDTPGVFIQIRRALKPDGLFLAAVPGSGTLQELREALLAAESEKSGGASPRVIPFADVRDLGALLQRAGFALPVADTENYTVRYDTMFGLMRDLRAMGMANPLVGRSRKPLRRETLVRAAEIYAERFSDPDGRIRATFSIVYLAGWAPHENQQKPLKPGSAKVRLADALKTQEIKI